MARDLTKRRTERELAPALGFKATLRFWWGQLTSMRTALVLLFCLAVAAIPGSIVPQRSISPIKVENFIDANPELGRFYDTIGMFDVFTSPWFSAIYLLLFVSLIGCIVPRVQVYLRALRAEPVKVPARLTRLPAHRVGAIPVDVDGDPEDPAEMLRWAEKWLRKRRYRVAVRDRELSAERGYLREAGNLVFHLSLILVLVGVAIGSLYGYRGTAVVVVGQGFSNTVTQYDDLTSGGRFSSTDLAPFAIKVNSFEAEYETGPVQTGAARVFRANVTVTDTPGATPHDEVLEVNHPLTIGGTEVHLLGHGYAPKVTVRDAAGNIAWSGPVVFLPQDGNFTSAGAVKAVDARPERLAFQGFFLPSGDVEVYGPTSQFPGLLRPQLVLNAWYGPPRTETGVAENVYSLDTRGLTQLMENGEPFRMYLSPGQTVELPEGKGSVTFDGVEQWVQLQISRTPALPLTAVGIGLAVTGLSFSLFVRPRRLWVRIRDEQVEIAGLDRADARHGLEDEVAELAAVVCDEQPGVAHPSVERGRDAGDEADVAEATADAYGDDRVDDSRVDAENK